MIKLSYIEQLLTTGVDQTHIIYGEPIESIRELQKALGGEIESYGDDFIYTVVKLDNDVIIHTASKEKVNLPDWSWRTEAKYWKKEFINAVALFKESTINIQNHLRG